MRSSLLSLSFPYPFYLIDKDTVHLLNKFVYKQIKLIPHPPRFNQIKRSNPNNLQCFLNLKNQSFINQFGWGAYNDLKDYKEVSALYDYVYQIIKAITSGNNSMESFTARRILIYGVLDPSTDDMEKYLEDSPIRFRLFAFLYDIIFKGLELTEYRKEILKHRFGYSNRYEKLTCTEIAERVSKCRDSVYQIEQSLDRTIRDIIKVFRVFSPFYSYRSRYLSGRETVKVSPAVFDCIRREEGVEEMTDVFIAKVLAVIYNYEIDNEYSRANEDYLLIYKGDTKKTIIRFGNQEAERN
jgi:hypothetical protein